MAIQSRPLHFFVPGQVIFHVTRSAGATDAQILAAVQAEVNESQGTGAAESNFTERLSANTPRILSQPVSGQAARRASVVYDLGYDDSPEGIAALVAEVDRLRGGFRGMENAASLGAGSNAQINDISLNWLMTGAPGIPSTTGGTGARPVPVTSPTQPYSDTLNGDFSQVDWASLIAGSATPGEINVVLLDTAPAMPLLSARFDELVLQKLAAGTQHPVLHQLLGTSNTFNTALSPDGTFLTVSGNGLPNSNLTFRISYNLSKDVDGQLIMEALANPAIMRPHDYVMSDHGLFAAGQIARLVQAMDSRVKVNIHLVQVLGDYGVGTLETLEEGLNWALASGVNGLPLVINSSLLVSTPRDKGHLFTIDDVGLTLPTITAMLAQVGPAMAVLEADFIAAAGDTRYNGVNLVAAAGNDSLPNLPPVRARFPAAFNSVMGVAALNADLSPAPYSNEADDPIADGTQAYGGEVIATVDGWVATATNGLIGVYIGAFPTGSGPVPSVNGWGAWAGTSFASPRAAAALAILRSTGLSAAAAAAAI
jgi:hypothetical protein